MEINITDFLEAVTNPTESRDILDLLKDDHSEVENLFREIEETSNRAFVTRSQLYSELKELLGTHAHAEEMVLYKEMQNVPELHLKKESFEGAQEHAVIDSLFAKLDKIEPESTELWEATIKVLKEAFAHHIREEENVFFADVRERFTLEERESMGQRFIRAKVDLLTGKAKPKSVLKTNTPEARSGL